MSTGLRGTMAVAAVFVWTVCCAYGQDAPYLVKDGASAYRILLEPTASPSEKWAAQELQANFKACTGVELPIVEGALDAGIPSLVLGCGAAAEALGVTPDAKSLGEQGYLMRTVAPHLVIAGTPAAGTMYGVLDFLEESLGVRWYAPGVTKTPSVTELASPAVDKLVKPAFAWRHTSYSWPGGDEAFRTHERDNNGGGRADHPYGTQYTYDGTCHTYFNFISPGEFWETHPEYFSEIGGVRRRDDTQLCLTNPEVLEIVTERMLKRMAENPNARQHNFSQQDYYNACECPKCKAINEKYGSAGGTQFWFVNQLAERTSKAYPDKLIGTLAYMYTEEPPKNLTMHPNAAVWLCHMFPSCDSHPIATCELNADYKRRAMAWSKICQHLYIWHYVVDFAHYYNPFPNFRAMAADMKFYHEIGVEGIYLQGMSAGGGGGEFSLLRPYLGMKLLWHPEQDADAIIRDFLGGYYGAASEPIWKYITLLHDKVTDEHIHMHLYTNPAQGYLPDEVVAQSEALFDEAEAAVAGDDELVERVKVARMPLVYARIFPRDGYTIENQVLKFNGPMATAAEAGAMYERMEKHGFTSIREMEGDPKWLPMFAALLNLPTPAPRLSNGLLAVDVVPFLGGRVLRIIDEKTGECVTANDVTRYLIYPFGGGEETRWGGIFSPTGFFDQFALTEKTETSITLTTKHGALDVKREITLASDEPTLTIEASLTNASDKPQEVAMRSHMELDLGDLLKTRIRFTDRQGQDVDRDMKPIVANLREGEHYYDENAPNGEWRFTGNKGLEVTQRFDAAALDFTWAYAYPDYLNDLEVEVWNKPVTLAPGETAALTQDIEVGPMPK